MARASIWRGLPAARCSTSIRAPACRAWPCRPAGTRFRARAAVRRSPARFRDHFGELKRLGVKQLYGLSTQDTAYQQEAASRLHLPFAILSDEKLAFARALKLPTFSVDGMTLIKRMALIIDDGVITKAFYPVFPPDKNADEVVAWIKASTA